MPNTAPKTTGDQEIIDFAIDGPHVTISEAAWMTRKTHQTIRNAISGKGRDKSKHMSSTKGLRNGKNQILVEIIELERCFGKLRYPPSYLKQTGSDNPTYDELKELSDDEIKAGYIYIKGEMKRLEEELAAQRQKNSQLEDKIDALVEERDSLRQSNASLLKITENQSEELKLLPDLSETGKKQSEQQVAMMEAINNLTEKQTQIEEHLKPKPKKKWFKQIFSNDPDIQQIQEQKEAKV